MILALAGSLLMALAIHLARRLIGGTWAAFVGAVLVLSWALVLRRGFEAAGWTGLTWVAAAFLLALVSLRRVADLIAVRVLGPRPEDGFRDFANSRWFVLPLTGLGVGCLAAGGALATTWMTLRLLAPPYLSEGDGYMVLVLPLLVAVGGIGPAGLGLGVWLSLAPSPVYRRHRLRYVLAWIFGLWLLLGVMAGGCAVLIGKGT